MSKYWFAAVVGGALTIGLFKISVAIREPVVNGAASGRRVMFYRDPMHPSYTSSTPGKAPDCGMDLQPVFADEVSSAPERGSHAGTIHLNSEELERIGVSTAPVRRSAATHTLRTIGRVEVAENRLFPIRAGGSGTVARIAPRTETGSAVRTGQALVSVYGRDYTTAQRTYLYALRASENPPPTFAGQLQDPNVLPLEEAKRDLQSAGFDEAQIAQLTRTRQVMLDVTITAPATGTVVTRSIFPGQRFEHGAELFVIADLTHVWVSADVGGAAAAHVPAGTPATVLIPSAPDASVRAVVANTLPRFDAVTRTGRVRLDVDNPRLVLKPGMFVDVLFDITLPKAITIPTEAIVDTGGEQAVFVDVGGGNFERRTIETGWRLGGYSEVRRGLIADDSVVVKGAFLLQSEHRIRYGTTASHD